MPSLAVNLPQDQPEELKPVLQIEDLHTWFEVRRLGFFKAGDVRALDGVTFNLYEGETVSIVGESGCGKRPWLKRFWGCIPPHKGKDFFSKIRT